MSTELKDILTNKLSECCDAYVTETGFCSDCYEHATGYLHIEVIVDNDNDWVFTLLNDKNGKHFGVF